MTRRAAAERFGVAASTAVRWVHQWRQTGSVEPRPQGGDKRSHRIEVHAEGIQALVDETPDMTLAEIAAHLEGAHGLRVAQGVSDLLCKVLMRWFGYLFCVRRSPNSISN